jgi:hypothetical protein
VQASIQQVLAHAVARKSAEASGFKVALPPLPVISVSAAEGNGTPASSSPTAPPTGPQIAVRTASGVVQMPSMSKGAWYEMIHPPKK